jgi:hypothetical protein
VYIIIIIIITIIFINCNWVVTRWQCLFNTYTKHEICLLLNFLGVKAAGAQCWHPCHLHVPIGMKSRSLNLLEPSGPVKACNGIALSLPLLQQLGARCWWHSGWGTALQTGSSRDRFIFHWHILPAALCPWGRLSLLTEMSTRNVSWGKGSRCVGLTTLPPSCADCLKIWEPQPAGTLRARQGL